MAVEKMKADVLEIIAIVKECPEKLQEKCLELLLSHYLSSSPALDKKRSETTPSKPPSPPPGDQSEVDAASATKESAQQPAQEDIISKDLHAKFKKFLARNGLTIEDINELYFKQGDTMLPLFDDLKTNKMTESQLRVALLRALVSAMNSGEFEFNGEEVRAECIERKCYDQPNFAATFNRNENLFDGFSQYDKSSPKVKLSEEGRKRLSEIIGELK
jgi:SOS response regulatory protein OraA/RecX